MIISSVYAEIIWIPDQTCVVKYFAKRSLVVFHLEMSSMAFQRVPTAYWPIDIFYREPLPRIEIANLSRKLFHGPWNQLARAIHQIQALQLRTRSLYMKETKKFISFYQTIYKIKYQFMTLLIFYLLRHRIRINLEA